MDDDITKKLLQLNAAFYQTFASQFSDTRQRIQPGVRRILASVDSAARILDLGCGNGELARELTRCGFKGQYIGLDFSEELLNVARQGIASGGNFRFIQGNLADPGWDVDLRSTFPVPNPQFTIILAFASLHHIPGR